MPQAEHRDRLTVMAGTLAEMVDFAERREDYVLAAKLEDARVTIVQRCGDMPS
ncbi:hypothetical protein [Sphingomonas sp. OK281]|uniref:hypothetical protein n=1 Tax=Sphingomonas sp. OK281 TaxID=1881067 RepID=UPI0008E7E8D8|nr:hypothetical protein [Sphingomonas sp. OK281]SFN71427.1 hypothetical protein SAMN05428984_0327 [Sphingomonas sp. OK281]